MFFLIFLKLQNFNTDWPSTFYHILSIWRVGQEKPRHPNNDSNIFKKGTKKIQEKNHLKMGLKPQVKTNILGRIKQNISFKQDFILINYLAQIWTSI